MDKAIAVRTTAIVLGLALGLWADLRFVTPVAAAPDDVPADVVDMLDPDARSQEAQSRIMEGLPTWYVMRVARRDKRILDDLGQSRTSEPVKAGLVILKRVTWTPGSTVTVAFNGGKPRLHALIERIATEWTEYANIKLDFGKNANGAYRTWSREDKVPAANIRIAFQGQGYWTSALGKGDKTDVLKAGDATMNFQNFDKALPSGFAGIIRHEFGHALGLEHEHQHPVLACDFRWDDDPDYEFTTDDFGQFIVDDQGRHPGMYTVMGGPPNNWSRAMIDYNLRQLTERPDTPLSAFGFGSFDKLSIMKYYYPDWMFLKGKNSPCFSPGVNRMFSEEDKKRIAEFYPKDTAVAAAQVRRRSEAIAKVLAAVPQASLLAQELRARQHELQ